MRILAQGQTLERASNMIEACPVCNYSPWEIFFEIFETPIFCNILWSTQEAAKNCERGDIQLAFCPVCGFIGNSAFEPALVNYSEMYENSLDFSSRFKVYMDSLVSRLIQEYDLYKKKILEIGCGKGEFLASLCKLGENQGLGFDPTYIPLPEHNNIRDKVQFIQEFYSEKHAHYQSDFIVCRHTLEHIQTPTHLLRILRESLVNQLTVPIFFEVPNSLSTFRHMAIWDIIYEHCCFFTPVSLATIFSLCGFNVNKLDDEFEGQFLCIECTPGAIITTQELQNKECVEHLAHEIAEFASNFQQKLEYWKSKLLEITDTGKCVTIWGAGSKGVTFLNMLDTQSHIEYVVDINPRKQGMYIAGTGQKIVPPEFLQTYQPDIVIVMNPNYIDEIRATTDSFGLTPELLTA